MTDQPSYPTAQLDYALPPELIAQHPLAERRLSRLLHVQVARDAITDRAFAELPELLPPETLIVLNNSRVIPARVYGRRPLNAVGQGGGRVEILFHRFLDDGVCEAVVGSGAAQPAGEQVELPEDWRCELLEPKAVDGSRVRYRTPSGAVAKPGEVLAYLERVGLPPTPPYIKREADSRETDKPQLTEDIARYQTVYAREPGSVAAPTAGLHFDQAMLDALAAAEHSLAYVTLHVGLGTFAPVRVDDLAQHAMHAEGFGTSLELYGALDGRHERHEPVLAVGTTSLRVLHSLLDREQRECEYYMDMGEEDAVLKGTTRAFIYPGHGTDACDLLLTNFHLPRSTLLALVYAFGGEELMRRAYAHAIAERYRFYSYGDCMLIDRR